LGDSKGIRPVNKEELRFVGGDD